MVEQRRKRRYIPGLFVAALAALSLGFAAWAFFTDPFGDSGMRNVFTALGVVLASLVLFSWFVVASAWSPRLRLGAALAAPCLVAAFAAAFRYEGVSGSMIPSFSWRWSEPRVLALPREGDQKRVDLTTVRATDFPGFLGAQRDATVHGVDLARDWQARPPELLWRKDIGKGWSGFAIVNGVAITQEQRGERELVTAYAVQSGDLLWSHDEDAHKTHPVGGDGPRATPLIDEGRVYALGAFGVLLCLDGADGRLLWRRDLPRDFGISPDQEARVVDYGRSNSPLIIGKRLFCPVGGEDEATRSGIVAFDKVSGATIWKGPSRHLSQASPQYARLAGVDQVLVVNEASVSGHDPETGVLFWEHPWPGRTSADPNCSQPVPVAPDSVLVSKGYGQGSALLRLVPAATGWRVEVRWASRRSLRTKFTNVVIRGDYIFGLSDGILECVELATGKRVWKKGRYGHGQILLVGDLLLVLSEEGELFLVEASHEAANQVLGSMPVLEGITWNTLALTGDLLAIRNARQAAVYRLPLR